MADKKAAAVPKKNKPAKAHVKNPNRVGFLKRIGNCFKNMWGEMRKMAWPTRSQILNNLIITLAMIVIIGVFIWLIDMGSSWLVQWIYDVIAQ